MQQILKALAAGQTPADILLEYPELEPKGFQSVLLYAADVMGEQRVCRLSA